MVLAACVCTQVSSRWMQACTTGEPLLEWCRVHALVCAATLSWQDRHGELKEIGRGGSGGLHALASQTHKATSFWLCVAAASVEGGVRSRPYVTVGVTAPLPSSSLSVLMALWAPLTWASSLALLFSSVPKSRLGIRVNCRGVI